MGCIISKISNNPDFIGLANAQDGHGHGHEYEQYLVKKKKFIAND